MKKFNRHDLRQAFASGIDFSVTNNIVGQLKSHTFRDKGFDDIYIQIKKIKKAEKARKKKELEQIHKFKIKQEINE